MTQHEIVDFTQDVVEASRRTPVLVDFWAPWCGPCRILGPILETLEGEADGAWRLAKVNVDEHPDLAARYGIQGIPAVKLFREGEPVAEFVGALPEASVRKWLQENLPSQAAPALAEAQAALAAGRAEDARRLLEEELGRNPQDPEARLLLARIELPRSPKRARELLSEVGEEDPSYPEAERLLWLADLPRRLESEAVGGPAADLQLYRHAAGAFFSGDMELALETWLELVGKNRELDADGARRALVAAFVALGPDHPLTRTYRPRLASAIY